jgi:hypothetical protein
MKKTSFFTIVTVMAFIFLSFTKETRKAASGQIMLYGVAYTAQCNTEAYKTYTYQLIDTADYNKEKQNLEAQLNNWEPNATRIRVSSSKYDFGESATNMCVIKWSKKSNNCSYEVVYVAFGSSHEDALNRAIKQKNSYGGSDVSYSILENKYWY